MLLVGIFSLLLLAGGATSEGNCSYLDILNHLGFTNNYSPFSMSRSVKNHTSATEVDLDLLLYAILEVQEKEQKFVPYVVISMYWENEYIRWDPEEFCGITFMSIPAKLVWKPDIIIVEMTERDKVTPSPYLTITSIGYIELVSDQVLTTTCRMQVYKFPFDTQSCNLTFKSLIHTDNQIKLRQMFTSSDATEYSQDVMRTQYEWEFINMTITNTTVNYWSINRVENQTHLIYTINMKRRSALYIVNFILPILFLLCLDLASFLVSDSSGEKLGFKVTVLLAIIVMQLVLNEILPSSSDSIPLIAVYCIGVFAMMMLSLLETVLVMHLIGKDSAPRDHETEKDRKLSEDREDKRGVNCDGAEKTWNSRLCAWDVSADETPAERLEMSSSQLTEQSQGVEELSEDLREAVKTRTLLLNSRSEERKPGYWTRKAQIINKWYFICYVVAASLFLLSMVLKWNGQI